MSIEPTPRSDVAAHHDNHSFRDWDALLAMESSSVGGFEQPSHAADFSYNVAAPFAMHSHELLAPNHALSADQAIVYHSRSCNTMPSYELEQHQHRHYQVAAMVDQSRQLKSHKRRAEDLMQADGAANASGSQTTHVGRWTKREHELFLEGLKLYGRSWKKISTLVVTRTLVQIRTHAQKYLQKQSRVAQKLATSKSSDEALSHADAMPRLDPELYVPSHEMTWKLQQHHHFQPVAFPGASSGSESSFDGIAESALTSSMSLVGSPNVGLVSSFKLDQLLQDEPSGLGDSEIHTSPCGVDDELFDGSHDAKMVHRILSPPTELSRPRAIKHPRSDVVPHVLSGHELFNTFDHLNSEPADAYTLGDLHLSPLSPAVTSTGAELHGQATYCDWMS